MKIREFSESISFERLAMAQAGGEVALPLQHWGRFLPAEFAHFWDLSIFSTFLELGRLTGFNELLLEFGSLAALWLSYFVDPILLWMNGKKPSKPGTSPSKTGPLHGKHGVFVAAILEENHPFVAAKVRPRPSDSQTCAMVSSLLPWFLVRLVNLVLGEESCLIQVASRQQALARSGSPGAHGVPRFPWANLGVNPQHPSLGSYFPWLSLGDFPTFA